VDHLTRAGTVVDGSVLRAGSILVVVVGTRRGEVDSVRGNCCCRMMNLKILHCWNRDDRLGSLVGGSSLLVGLFGRGGWEDLFLVDHAVHVYTREDNSLDGVPCRVVRKFGRLLRRNTRRFVEKVVLRTSTVDS
jgi:hypothetical protein